jgi:hypothetical protein
MRALIVICFTAAFFSTVCFAQGHDDTAAVLLQVIQCKTGQGQVPQLLVASASDYPKLKYQAYPARTQMIGNGYYQLNLNIMQGNYFFKVQSTDCANYLQAAVISGHRRSLSMPLFHRSPKAAFEGNLKLFDEENALAGTLPIRPEVAFIVAQGGGKRILDLQDGSYYIERIPPGKYTIRMEFHGGFQSELGVDLTNILPKQFVERDFDISEIRRHLGNILPSGATLQNCGWCY